MQSSEVDQHPAESGLSSLQEKKTVRSVDTLQWFGLLIAEVTWVIAQVKGTMSIPGLQTSLTILRSQYMCS